MSLEKDIQAAKDAIAKTKAVEAKAKAEKEAAAKKEAAGRAEQASKAVATAQLRKNEALLKSMLETRKKLIDVVANPKSSKRDLDAANTILKGRPGQPALDASIKKLATSLNVAVEGNKIVGKINPRPMSVPASATYDEKTKTWTRGNENWDSAGKRITTAATPTATKTTQGASGPDATLTKTRTEASAAAKAKADKIKAEAEAKAAADLKKNEGATGPTGPTGPVAGAEVPSGFNVGSFRMAEEASMGAAGSKTATDDKPLTPFDEILAKAKATYGDIDSVFNDDPELNALLRAAIGNVADVNDDMKDTEFLNRLKNTKWWQTSAGDVRQRGFEKRQYLRLKEELDKNKTDPDYQKKLDKLNNENAYARGLAEAKGELQLVVNQEGLNVTDQDLTDIAGGLYDLANEKSTIGRLDALTRYVTASGLAEGPTGKALRLLRTTARANGVDLNEAAGKTGIDNWLKNIFKGKDPADYEQLIREYAGRDQNKYVKDLLAAGTDLRDIYAPFLREMAGSLGITDINSIDLNDPLLKSAFTDKGAINTTQFRNLLRTDTRFKGTPVAIEEGNVEAQARQQLARIAQDNGYNLDVDFKDQVNGWLARIRNGESVDLVGQAIRDKAGEGRGEYVAGLLKSGYNLNGIYGNYIKLMSQYFGIDPETISENDPLLQKVFNDKGGLKFSDFEALLRSDARYKGTQAEGQQKDFSQAVADRALALGVTLGQKEVDEIVNNALAMGISASSSLVDGLIRAKLTYSPTVALGGAAGGALAQLKKTAAANGLDFDAQFGNQAQTWLSKILQGESPDTFENVIRETAARGLPDNVKSLLKLGVNLDTVYAPYKNIMASVLEVNPETINLNDKTLRSAIGPEKEMTLYDWERSLRKDSRWQYTNNARQEVSGIGLNVLQQLGFQG
jgi:hypothetical protein